MKLGMVQLNYRRAEVLNKILRGRQGVWFMVGLSLIGGEVGLKHGKWKRQHLLC